ncbi:hypothetical protein EBH_0001490 [Eimeria brunetti]|uniref:Transmembrane protein n=1 Tax=Eimeria brunetti TaxID=51314 RepID=U6LSV4_9EIME|nr:hypothetical protein EBH_0001490 [Eimeria brunetti]
MLPAIATETREDEEGDKELKSPRTPAEDEIGEAQVHLSPLGGSRRASWTPSTLAGKPGPRKWSFFISLTLTIPLLAILLIWSVCVASHRRVQAAGGVNRRLSDSDGNAEFEEGSILDDCIALEADLGISHAQRQYYMHGDPSQQIASLVSLFSNAAAEFEWNRNVQSTLGGGPSHVSFRGVPDGGQRNTGERSARSGRTRDSGGGRELTEPAAKRVKFTVSASDTRPELRPEAWIEGAHTADIQQGQEGDPFSSQAAGSGISESVGLFPAPSAPLAVRPPQVEDRMRYGSTNLDYHPYVRLPVLEPGVVPQPFYPAEVFFQPPTVAIYKGHLVEIRRLLVKQTLNQDDTDMLVRLVTELANSLWFRSSASVRQVRPIFAAVSLGSTFLAMDAVVAVVQLLGRHMKTELWWDKFAAAIDTNYSVELPSQIPRKTTKFHTDLANDLLGALRIYKTGKRPQVDTVIELKLRLFFSPLSPPLFQDALFDPYRRDHNLFRNFGYVPE